MTITNEDLQQKFQDYLNGEIIQFDLLTVFFRQNGGFTVRTQEKDKAIGISRSGETLNIAFINLIEEDDMLMAEEIEAFEIVVGDDVKHTLNALLEKSYNYSGDKRLDLDPENSEGMYK